MMLSQLAGSPVSLRPAVVLHEFATYSTGAWSSDILAPRWDLLRSCRIYLVVHTCLRTRKGFMMPRLLGLPSHIHTEGILRQSVCMQPVCSRQAALITRAP